MWQNYAVTWRRGTLGWNWEDDELKSLSFADALLTLGQHNWELVGAVPLSRDGDTVAVEYLFKRQSG